MLVPGTMRHCSKNLSPISNNPAQNWVPHVRGPHGQVLVRGVEVPRIWRRGIARIAAQPIFAVLLIVSGHFLPAQQAHAPAGASPAAQLPALTQDTDPVRSPDTVPPVPPT